VVDIGFPLVHLPLTREPFSQIHPSRILPLNHPDFLLPPPTLDLLLPRNSAANLPKFLKVNQPKNPVPRSESRNQPLPVFDQPAFKVIGNTGVKVSRPASQSVDAVAMAHNKTKSRSLTPVRQNQATGFGMTTNPKKEAKQAWRDEPKLTTS
jgi:hypothetical protein